jgi:hypothetical protein
MSNLEQLIECCNNVIQAMEQDRLGKSDYKQGYISAMELIIHKAKQLQKEEPKTYTQEEIDQARKESFDKGYELAYDKYKFTYKD